LTWELHFSKHRERVAIFVSKYDHCLYDLLLRHASGELRAEIALVVSNHPDLWPLAEKYRIPYHVFPITPATKKGQEAKQLALLEEHRVGLIILDARFRRPVPAPHHQYSRFVFARVHRNGALCVCLNGGRNFPQRRLSVLISRQKDLPRRYWTKAFTVR
jgi:hypothetical protein